MQCRVKGITARHRNAPPSLRFFFDDVFPECNGQVMRTFFSALSPCGIDHGAEVREWHVEFRAVIQHGIEC